MGFGDEIINIFERRVFDMIEDNFLECSAENMPIQIYSKFHLQNLKIFR